MTGADGFVGTHVVEAAKSRGHEVAQLVRRPQTDATDSDVFVADLIEQWPDVGAIDAVVHLAGLASVGPSYDSPGEYISTSTRILATMGEALRVQSHPPVVIVVSSGAVYAPSMTALTETSPLRMASPYVVSKVALEGLAEYYRTRGLTMISARPFNHIGPGQRSGFLVPDLISRLEQLPEDDELSAGDLSTARDYTDVRDVAAAYLDLCENVPSDGHLFNVASGTARTGHEVLRAICDAMGREVPLVKQDESRLRPADNPIAIGDASALRTAIGWEPHYSFAESIHDAVAFSQGAPA